MNPCSFAPPLSPVLFILLPEPLLTNDSSLTLLMTEQHSTVCKHHIFVFHSSAGGCSGLFYDLTVMHFAAVNKHGCALGAVGQTTSLTCLAGRRPSRKPADIPGSQDTGSQLQQHLRSPWGATYKPMPRPHSGPYQLTGF